MLLSAVSVLVVAQSSLEIPEGLMNNTVYELLGQRGCAQIFRKSRINLEIPGAIVQNLVATATMLP